MFKNSTIEIILLPKENAGFLRKLMGQAWLTYLFHICSDSLYFNFMHIAQDFQNIWG